MKLKTHVIRSLTPDKKTKRHYDGGGLYLEVRTTGNKFWRWKYRFEGKEKLLSFGQYPTVSLKEARLRRDKAALTLAEGIDPGFTQKRARSPLTFREVAEDWLSKQTQWKPNHHRTVVGRLNNDVYNTLGDRPIDDLQPIDFLHTLRLIEARGAHVTAHKVKGICGQICRYAVASCIIPSDPTRDLKGALTPPKRNHFAAFTTKEEAGALMGVIKGYNGFFVTKCALLMTAYTFTRQGELRHAEWSEVDLSERQWIIPAHKMKMKREHIVPLSDQVMELLLELRKVSGQGSTFSRHYAQTKSP
jgi:integrase